MYPQTKQVLVTLNRTVKIMSQDGDVYNMDAFVGEFINWGDRGHDEVRYKVCKIFGKQLPNGASSIETHFRIITLRSACVVSEQEIN